MSGKPAARIGDRIACPVHQETSAIVPPGEPTVLIEGQPAARLGDESLCPGPTPNPIVEGAYPVVIGGSPAARIGDSGAHPGSVIMPPGGATVLIGLAGTTGNVRVGTQMCRAAAAGRASGSTQQTYGNCGVESARQLINHATGADLSENDLLIEAIRAEHAEGIEVPELQVIFIDGGADADGIRDILASNSVATTIVETTSHNLGLAMSRGQGVIVNLDASVLWGPPARRGSWHSVLVTGVEYDDAGNRVAVIINDTGTGQCGQRIPPDRFDQATAAHPNPQMVITTDPIW